MANPKTKVILTAHCRFDDKHHEMGEIFELDLNSKADADFGARMGSRLAVADEKTVKAIQEEAERMKRHEERGLAEAQLVTREREISLREKALELDKREKEVEKREAAAAGGSKKPE